jgi:hypothetical protein
MRALALIVSLALATSALAQVPDFTPRSAIQAEQDRRIQGPGFEQSLRTNPQLYPYPPPPPASALGPSAPGASPLTPAPPGLAPLSQPLPGPIPPVTHLHSHRPVKPPPAAKKPPPVPKEKPPVTDLKDAPQTAPEEEKTAP